MTLDEALISVDMDDIIDRMTAYAISYFKYTGIKQLNGLEPVDFVADVLMKVIAGVRDWQNANCSFEEFLFGSLRSHLYNFNKGNKHVFVDDEPEVSDNNRDYEFEDQKNMVLAQLVELGADNCEIDVFKCWLDNMYKPAEIAEQLNVDVSTINNAKKRLVRKLQNLRTKIPDIL